MCTISKLSDGTQLNMANLSVKELRKLHCEEEWSVVEELLTLKPFSNERKELLRKGSKFVKEIQFGISKKRNKIKKSFGADIACVKILIKLVVDKLKKNTSRTIMCEAGVGTMFSINELLHHCAINQEYENKVNLSIKGCDIFTLPSVKTVIAKYKNFDIEIKESHIFDYLKTMPDNSIDIFYADNVFEHFFPDEAEIIFSEIAKKLKPEAYVFLIVPNKFTGPHDVSKFFLPFGARARGFHLMEMSFNELTAILNKYNIYHSHCVFGIPGLKLFYTGNNLLLKIKLASENIFAKIPSKFLRKAIFDICGYSVSIMKCKKEVC